jgi:outer membrane protein assembly factor BamB
MTATISVRWRGLTSAALVALLAPTVAVGQSAPAPPDPPAATFVWSSSGDPDDPLSKAANADGVDVDGVPGGAGAVTVAPDGRVWVLETGMRRIAIFEPDGAFVEYWGTEGTGPGEFVLHRANGDGFTNLAFAPDESIFILDAGNRRVQHFAPDRSFLNAWGGFGSEPGRFASPLWLAVDIDGTVLVVDDVRNVVERFAPDGTVLATFEAVPQDVGTAVAIEVDGHGGSYVSTCCRPGGEAASIRHYDRDGSLLDVLDERDSETFTVLGGSMSIDQAGRIFVNTIDEDPIHVLAPGGSLVGRFGRPMEGAEGPGFAWDTALDGKGGIYVTDFLGGVVRKYQLGPGLVPDAAIAEWPMFKGDAARRGEGSDGPVGEPVLRWRYQAGGAVPGNVSVGGDLVYASSDDGVLHALDVVSGAERWSLVADDAPLSGPVVDDGTVYVFDGGGILHAVDAATGEERWRAARPVAGPSSATAGDGAVFVGSGDGALVAIDAGSGGERWRAASETGGPVHSPAFSAGRVYVTSEGGGYVAVDATDGSLVWRFDTGDLSTGTAVVADGVAYVGASGEGGIGTLWALDAETGTEMWRIERPFFTPAVADGVAYSGSAELGVTALDTATGEPIWTFPVRGPARPLGVADGIVYVPADAEHRVYALDAATGAEAWRFDVDSGIDCCIAVGRGAVYVGTWLGSVYAIGGNGLR